MVDIYTGDAIGEVNDNETISESTQTIVSDILNELSDEAGNNRAEFFDPNTTPPEDTDLLIVEGDVSGVELNLGNLGQTPVIDATGAGSGIQVNLEQELDPETGDVPEVRVIVGSAFDDTVIGGKADLIVDLGDGDDKVQTGEGDDQVYMGAGDDDIRLGGGGTDFIDGGDGEDRLTLSGSAQDWTSVENEDGSRTWTHTETLQTVTTVDVEHVDFEADQSSPNVDEFEDTDPDDI